MRGWPLLALLGLAACPGVQPVAMSQEARLQTPSVASPGSLDGVQALVGHLKGAQVPRGSRVKRAVYSALKTRVVLTGVQCGPRVEAAYAVAGTLPAGATRSCQGETLTLEHGGPTLDAWNPWEENDWHVGPFERLPQVSTGESFKPAELIFDGLTAEAHLTPKSPGPFVDVIGAGLADADWAARPVPGGTTYVKAGWTTRIDQNGAMVTVWLEGPPASSEPAP